MKYGDYCQGDRKNIPKKAAASTQPSFSTVFNGRFYHVRNITSHNPQNYTNSLLYSGRQINLSNVARQRLVSLPDRLKSMNIEAVPKLQFWNKLFIILSMGSVMADLNSELVIGLLPMLAFYFIFRKQITKGVAAGAVKG